VLSETAVTALFLRVDLLRRFDIRDDIYAWRGVIAQLFTEANRNLPALNCARGCSFRRSQSRITPGTGGCAKYNNRRKTAGSPH